MRSSSHSRFSKLSFLSSMVSRTRQLMFEAAVGHRPRIVWLSLLIVAAMASSRAALAQEDLSEANDAAVKLQLSPGDFGDALLPELKQHRGDVAVAVAIWDTDNEELCRWSYRGDKVMPTASLIKLPLMMTVYQQAHQGQLSLDSMVELREEDKVPGSGILTDHLSPGTQFSVRDLVRLMIRYSDNTATNMLVDQVGLPATTQLMAELALPETQLHSKVFRRDTSIALERSREYGLGSTTAEDMLQLLGQLERQTFLTPAACQEMLQHLLACEDQQQLGRSLPSGTKLAHKSGAVRRARTDAGIIYRLHAKILCCVLTNNNQDARWTDDNAAELLSGRVAKTIVELVDRDLAAVPGGPPLLRMGSRGELVEDVQRTLNQRINAQLSIDGDFGPATATAVRAFQSKNDLPQSGQVGANTWAALGQLVTSDAAVPPPEVVNQRPWSRSSALDVNGPPEVSANAWAVLDADSGNVVGSSDGTTQLPIASTTKLMTAYVVLRYAQDHPSALDEVITFSRRADETPGSTAGVRAGEQLTVRELMYGLLLPSGNDAAVALAEHFGQRLAPDSDASVYGRFVQAMNDQAKELGLSNTHFANPHGLTEDKHYSSAIDLAQLALAASKVPLLAEVVNTPEHGCRLRSSAGYTRDVLWTNTNRLLAQQGFSGMKTGTTSAAGACLVALGQQGERRRIVVVLGSDSSAARYIDARNLFRWTWR